MPKLKSFCAGTVLKAADIQQALMSVALSAVPLLQWVSRGILLYSGLGM